MCRFLRIKSVFENILSENPNIKLNWVQEYRLLHIYSIIANKERTNLFAFLTSCNNVHDYFTTTFFIE